MERLPDFEIDSAPSGNYYPLKVVQVCGYLGHDREGNYHDDESILKYLHIPSSPQVYFDLNLPHVLDDEDLECTLYKEAMYQWIMDHCKDKRGTPCKPKEKFVGFRSHMAILLISCYERADESWDLHAVKYRGSIYFRVRLEKKVKLREDKLKEMGYSKADYKTAMEDPAVNVEIKKTMKEAKSFENCNFMWRAGLKFKQHLVSKSRTAPPDPTHPVWKQESLSCVMSAQLGPHSMLYCGAMDAMPRSVDLNNLNQAKFVELKTLKENVNQYVHKRYRLLKWWSHGVLANISSLLVGYRDDEAKVVRKLQRMDVSDLPYLGQGWNSNTCLQFLQDLLTYVDTTMSDAPDGVEFQFQFRPLHSRVITAHRLTEEQAYGKILPKSYIEWLNSLP